MDEICLNRFFASVNAKLEGYFQFMKLVSPQLAPKFNMVECLYPDENRLSAIIAMLLDPKGEHGQGDTFLKLFFDVIDFKRDISYDRARREVEALTVNIQNSQRRIDILMHFDGFNLAIENKPWANDQDNQVRDYLEDLGKREIPYLLLYLSPKGTSPAHNSVKDTELTGPRESGNFKNISYNSHINNWIDLCIEKCRAQRVRSFLEDFREYIRIQFCGGLQAMAEQLVIEQAVKKENISAAFAIASSWPEIAVKLINELADLVHQRIELKYGKWEKKVDLNLYYVKNTGFSFSRKDKWSNYCVTFIFENTAANSFYIGVRHNEQREPNDNDKRIAAKLDINYEQKGYPNSLLVWWQYFESPYRDWSTSEKPWSGICENGETINSVASKLEHVIDKVAEIIDEIERK